MVFICSYFKDIYVQSIWSSGIRLPINPSSHYWFWLLVDSSYYIVYRDNQLYNSYCNIVMQIYLECLTTNMSNQTWKVRL